ncbi:MAG TPA: tetratricopeptide repeat protein [Syntrophorhabdaceae bacterium]|nr:tetratricopeptide repeat protein [Syntrophorhabdaceae bacterium]
MNKRETRIYFGILYYNNYKRVIHQCLMLFILFVFVSSITFFSACSTTQIQLSDKRTKGIELNQKGQDAFKKGEYIKALNYYLEALNISRSLENADSMGNNIINIAYVYYKIGEMEKAEDFVNQIINNIPFPYSHNYLIEALTIKALIYSHKNNTKDAYSWAERAIRLCESQSCIQEGRIYNIMSRILMQDKDNKTAMDLAKKALELNRKAKDSAEIGNSMRIIADLEFVNGDYDASLKFYQDAFVIDKELELSEKMISDLLGIAHVLEKLKRTEDAISYYRRALSISQGIGNKYKEKFILESLEKIKR